MSGRGCCHMVALCWLENTGTQHHEPSEKNPEMQPSVQHLQKVPLNTAVCSLVGRPFLAPMTKFMDIFPPRVQCWFVSWSQVSSEVTLHFPQPWGALVAHLWGVKECLLRCVCALYVTPDSPRGLKVLFPEFKGSFYWSGSWRMGGLLGSTPAASHSEASSQEEGRMLHLPWRGLSGAALCPCPH